jgi:hypothetical protein
MLRWSLLHGIVFGLPLVVLLAWCVSSSGKLGKVRPWLQQRRHGLQGWLWAGMLVLAWLTPLSGLVVMYARPEAWRSGEAGWRSLSLPWMASWGMMVPVAATVCVYLARRARQRALTPAWYRRGVWLLMALALGNTLLAALLGSMTAQGFFAH